MTAEQTIEEARNDYDAAVMQVKWDVDHDHMLEADLAAKDADRLWEKVEAAIRRDQQAEIERLREAMAPFLEYENGVVTDAWVNIYVKRDDWNAAVAVWASGTSGGGAQE